MSGRLVDDSTSEELF